MAIVSMFFIVLFAAFAAVAFFTEPSKTDKLIHSRLVSLDRKVVSSSSDEEGIVKQITFSTIPAFDRFLRNNRIAIGLQLLIEQSELHWTVGRMVFGTLLMISLGAILGNWWIAPGLIGWARVGNEPLHRAGQRRRVLAGDHFSKVVLAHYAPHVAHVGDDQEREGQEPCDQRVADHRHRQEHDGWRDRHPPGRHDPRPGQGGTRRELRRG